MVNGVDRQSVVASKLQTSWSNLLTTLQIDRQIGAKIFSSLVAAYSKGDRYYHNLQHLEHLLDLLREVEDRCQCFTRLQLTTWFHDYIYVPQAQDNELQSALYAADVLKRLHLSQDLIRSVEQIIISTQKHQPLVKGIDNLLFLDADLAILGASSNTYQQYARQVRQEYSYLSDRDYHHGRKRVLTEFISRPRIYYTDYFWQKFERQARSNLQAELNLYSTDN